jgi:hypothetical protein
VRTRRGRHSAQVQIPSAQCPILSRVRQLVAPGAVPTGPRSEAVVVPSLPVCEITPQKQSKSEKRIERALENLSRSFS